MALIAKFSGGTSSGNPMSQQPVSQVADKNFAAHPSPIKPPTMAELKAMQAKLESLTEPLPDVYAAYYGEDWKTQGDWYGRITSEYALLCAMDAPFNHNVYWGELEYVVRGFIGPNCTKDDTLRHWLHWRRTSDKRALWNVSYAFRRQAEWDDHGETYPLSMDGPDLWYLLDIKHPGVFQVSMYFFNKDGQDGRNRLRDYIIEIYPSPQQWQGVFEDYPKFAVMAEGQASAMPPLARSRVCDFWGGVHNQFVLKGPGSYFVKIDRNYSFNTIVSAVMIQQIDGEPTHLRKIIDQEGMYQMGKVHYAPPSFPEKINSEMGNLAYSLWNLLNDKYGYDSIKFQWSYRVKIFVASDRIAGEGEEAKQLADSIKWRLNQWDEGQRKEFEDTVLRGWMEYFCANALHRDLIKKNKNSFPEIYKEAYYDESHYPELQMQAP